MPIMDAEEVYAALNKKIKMGGGSTQDIENAVNKYLEENPVQPETNYEVMENKPKINGVPLSGDQTFEELGLAEEDTDIDFSTYFN